MQVLPCQLTRFAVSINVGAAHQHILHLAAVGTGVHKGRASAGAGNAVGKFQPRQAVLQRCATHLHQRRTGLGKNGIALYRYGREVLIHHQHRRINALVCHQQIRAVADGQKSHAVCPGTLHQRRDLLFRLREQQHPRRAADLKGGVQAHGLVFQIIAAQFPGCSKEFSHAITLHYFTWYSSAAPIIPALLPSCAFTILV